MKFKTLAFSVALASSFNSSNAFADCNTISYPYRCNTAGSYGTLNFGAGSTNLYPVYGPNLIMFGDSLAAGSTAISIGTINITGVAGWNSALQNNYGIGFDRGVTVGNFNINAGAAVQLIGSSTKNQYAMQNWGTINNLNNQGTIGGSSQDESTSLGITGYSLNYGTIGTLSNAETGVIYQGIWNRRLDGYNPPNGPEITVFNNYGAIATNAIGYFDIFNEGIIGALNNAQGGNNTSIQTKALTLKGNLPSSYNIIINGATHYGQLSVTGAVGNTVFGISSRSAGANIVSEIPYTSVLTGVTNTALGISGTSLLNATSNGYTYNLVQTGEGTNIWDLIVLSYVAPPPIGPSAADTLASMQPNAYATKNAFNSQYATLANGLNNDCTIFDANNVCVSVFGRNTSLNDSSFDSNAAGLILGYKPHAQFHIGTYIDQSLNNNTTGGVKVERSNPDVGVFGVWNMNADGSGLELRAAANYGKRDLNVTRLVAGDSSAEAGSGRSDLNAYGALLEASYAYAMNDTWIAKPYAGVRYLTIKRDSYKEGMTDAVQNPLSYSSLKQETTSAIVGARLNGKLAPKLMVSLNAGFEHDLHHRIDDYRATGVDDLGSIDMNSQKDRTRPTAGLGISYDVADKQRLSASVQYRKEVFMSESSTTGQVNYTIGF